MVDERKRESSCGLTTVQSFIDEECVKRDRFRYTTGRMPLSSRIANSEGNVVTLVDLL